MLTLFWSLKRIHNGEEKYCRDESIFDVLSRTESNQHERDEAESLTLEGGLKILWNLDRVTREQTLIQDDQSKQDWLRLHRRFSWFTEWSKKV